MYNDIYDNIDIKWICKWMNCIASDIDHDLVTFTSYLPFPEQLQELIVTVLLKDHSPGLSSFLVYRLNWYKHLFKISNSLQSVLYAVRATTEYKVYYQLIKHTGTFFSHFLHTLASNENKTQIITVLLSNSINIIIQTKKLSVTKY